jgi:hypothetical protein
MRFDLFKKFKGQNLDNEVLIVLVLLINNSY